MDTSYLAQQVNSSIGQLHGLFDEIGVPNHERESREAEVRTIRPQGPNLCPHKQDNRANGCDLDVALRGSVGSSQQPSADSDCREEGNGR